MALPVSLVMKLLEAILPPRSLVPAKDAGPGPCNSTPEEQQVMTNGVFANVLKAVALPTRIVVYPFMAEKAEFGCSVQCLKLALLILKRIAVCPGTRVAT